MKLSIMAHASDESSVEDSIDGRDDGFDGRTSQGSWNTVVVTAELSFRQQLAN